MNMEILIEKGEPKKMYQKLRIANKQYKFNFNIKLASFKVGDYIVRTGNTIGNIGVERKSSGDFNSSIIDGRLIEQGYILGENFDRGVILIEGDIYDAYSNLHDNSKLGALASLLTKYGVSIINVKDMDDSAFTILSMLKHANMSIDLSKIYKPRATLADRELGSLCCAEGIGLSLAKKVQKFYRIKDVANIRDYKLLSDKIHGMGKTKAQNLINLFSGFEGDPNFISDIDVLNFKFYLNMLFEFSVDKYDEKYKKQLDRMMKYLNDAMDNHNESSMYEGYSDG